MSDKSQVATKEVHREDHLCRLFPTTISTTFYYDVSKTNQIERRNFFHRNRFLKVFESFLLAK